MSAWQPGPDRVGDDRLRMSDAEREEAASELGEHYAQGRLTTEEHSERLDQIWAARTRGELAPIFRDLPSAARRSGGPVPPRGQARARAGITRLRNRLPGPVFLLLVVLAVVAILTHLPFLLIGLAVWFLFVRGACGGRPRW